MPRKKEKDLSNGKWKIFCVWENDQDTGNFKDKVNVHFW